MISTAVIGSDQEHAEDAEGVTTVIEYDVDQDDLMERQRRMASGSPSDQRAEAQRRMQQSDLHSTRLGPGDRMDGRALWCELWMEPNGDVTLTRGRGCTRADAIDLCRLAVADDPAVCDRTESDAPDPDPPAFSWIRSVS